MNSKEASQVLTFCDKFCSDNDNNRINEWSSGMFVKIIQGELNKLIQSDAQKEIEIQKKMEEFNKTIEGLRETIDEKQEELEELKNIKREELKIEEELKKKVENKVSVNTQASVIKIVEKTKEPSHKKQCRK